MMSRFLTLIQGSFVWSSVLVTNAFGVGEAVSTLDVFTLYTQHPNTLLARSSLLAVCMYMIHIRLLGIPCTFPFLDVLVYPQVFFMMCLHVGA